MKKTPIGTGTNANSAIVNMHEANPTDIDSTDNSTCTTGNQKALHHNVRNNGNARSLNRTEFKQCKPWTLVKTRLCDKQLDLIEPTACAVNQCQRTLRKKDHIIPNIFDNAKVKDDHRT